VPEFGLFGYTDEGARAAAAVPDEVLCVLVVDLRVEAGHVLVHHMDLVLGVAPDHASLLLQRVAAVDRRLALLDHQLVDLPLLALQLGRLPLDPPLPAPLPHLPSSLRLLDLAESLALLGQALPTAQFGTLQHLPRHDCVLKRPFPGQEVLIIALDAQLDPYLAHNIHVIIFLVIILEVILS